MKGVCRQYLSRTKPCALYEKDFEIDDNDYEDNNRGRCKKNEECLPPNDRAKHGYCQCKLGFMRKTEDGKCIIDKQENLLTSSTQSTSISSTSSSFDFEVEAGDDQIIMLPKNQIDLYGHVLYKSNKSEINLSILNQENLTLFWSLKSSTNDDGEIKFSNQEDVASHVIVKELREGVYEFELKLNDQQGRTLASDAVKVEALSAKTTASPLILKATSPITVRLPQQIIKLEAYVEPANRQVSYQWTYAKDGPVTPTLEVNIRYINFIVYLNCSF